MLVFFPHFVLFDFKFSFFSTLLFLYYYYVIILELQVDYNLRSTNLLSQLKLAELDIITHLTCIHYLGWGEEAELISLTFGQTNLSFFVDVFTGPFGLFLTSPTQSFLHPLLLLYFSVF